jgi:hypothetical protein
MTSRSKSPIPPAFLAGIAVVVLLLLGIYFWTEETREPLPVEQHLSLSDADRPYVEKITIGEIRMLRSTNMLGNEIIYVVGVAANNGNRTLADIEVTVEFLDFDNKAVLREQRRLFGKPPEPLAAFEAREFQLVFEGVPAAWNRNYPRVAVSGLLLQ